MRQYALTKLDKGDYVCPANDGRMLYRFTSYEDGKCLGLDVGYDSRTFWMVRATAFPIGALDFEDVRWMEIQYHLPSRKAALASVFGDDQ